MATTEAALNVNWVLSFAQEGLHLNQHIILGLGSGRCGTLSLAHVLNRQPGVQVSHEERPRLPWKRLPGEWVIRERFARMRGQRNGRIVDDVASFYLCRGCNRPRAHCQDCVS